jgi:ribosomal protein L20
MSEKDTIERVKERQGVFGKIQNIFTMGYGTKEDLRELDKKLRDYYYADFRDLRHKWEEIYLSALNAGQKSSGGHFKKVIQTLDRIAEKVNRADYGYAGLFDRKGSIRENEIARTFNYDKALEEDVKGIMKLVEELYSLSEADKWSDVEAKVKSIKSLILDFESKWNEREKEFRPLEM